MTRSSLLLAIDAGGSGSRAVVFRGTGEVVNFAYGAPCNYQSAGVKVVKARLRELLLKVIGPESESSVFECAVFGMAGLDTHNDLEILKKVILEICNETSLSIGKLVVDNDGVIASEGILGDGPGLTVISGTGSIVYGIKGSARVRVGGWGHRIGDEGSGFWIGKLGLMHVLRSLDGRESDTSMTAMILKKLGLNTADEIMQWIYNERVSVEQVAALAPDVLDLVPTDDAARDVFELARSELLLSAKTVIHRLDMKSEDFHVGLLGGVLQGSQLLRTALSNDITAQYPEAKIIQPSLSPLGAGALLAIQYSRGRQDRDFQWALKEIEQNSTMYNSNDL